MHTIDVLTWYISNNMLLCRPHKEILAPDQKATPSTNGPTINDINILGGGVKKWGETENMKGPGGGGDQNGRKNCNIYYGWPPNLQCYPSKRISARQDPGNFLRPHTLPLLK